MRKFFTLMMLGIMIAVNASAAEETLWEGDFYVTWAQGADESHKEWGGYNADPTLNQDIAYHLVAGTKIKVYLEVNDMKDGTEVYHKCQFDNWDWEALPGLAAIEFSENQEVTIEVTDELAAAVATKGFRLHGHGFNVVKVTKVVDDEGEEGEEGSEVIEDLEPALLWQGEAVIDGWGANVLIVNVESEYLETFAEKLTKACNLYFLVENVAGSDFRIAGAWGDWAVTSYPSDGYNHMQALDDDGVVKVALDGDFVKTAFPEQGGVAFWGNGGFKILAIGTTKDSVLPATDINEVTTGNETTDGWYTIDGIKLEGEPTTKGIYIVNGKKVIIK